MSLAYLLIGLVLFAISTWGLPTPRLAIAYIGMISIAFAMKLPH